MRHVEDYLLEIDKNDYFKIQKEWQTINLRNYFVKFNNMIQTRNHNTNRRAQPQDETSES